MNEVNQYSESIKHIDEKAQEYWKLEIVRNTIKDIGGKIKENLKTPSK